MRRLFSLARPALVRPFRPSPARILELLNEARAALALPHLTALPGGDVGSPHACPVALSLGAMVGVDALCFRDEGAAARVAAAWQTNAYRHASGVWIVRLPEVICRFVRDFDLGAYRDLRAAS